MAIQFQVSCSFNIVHSLQRWLPFAQVLLLQDIIHLVKTKTMFITTIIVSTNMIIMRRCPTIMTGTTRVTKAATTLSHHWAASGTVRLLPGFKMLTAISLCDETWCQREKLSIVPVHPWLFVFNVYTSKQYHIHITNLVFCL